MNVNNIPYKTIDDSAKITQLFFENYGNRATEFSATDVSAAIGFFTSRGFQEDAATATALAILEKAKAESKSVFQLLDTLKTLNGVQLSSIITKVLNQNRLPISKLGYRSPTSIPLIISRNIIA
jgi:hypothetical protein